MRIFACIFIAFVASSTLFGNYYRLDSGDADYDKLKDPPEPPSRDKNLHPSSLYKYKYPPRVEKKPDYSRREIPPAAKRPSAASKDFDTSRRPISQGAKRPGAINADDDFDYSRRDVPYNEQAQNRYSYRPKKQKHFFLLGANTGFDIYSYDNKRLFSMEAMLKLGYLFNFGSQHALRTYINLGGRFPFDNLNSNTLAFTGNFDVMVNVEVFHLYAGIGYGGEYYLAHKNFSHGVNVNLGISRSFYERHSVDVGVVIPFYTMILGDVILKNNIGIIVGYNYKF